MDKKLSEDTVAPEEYLFEFEELIATDNYSPQQLYKAYESGLSFKALPIKKVKLSKKNRLPQDSK